MLIIGTGGLAGDLLFSLSHEFPNGEIHFYNDTGRDVPAYVERDFSLLTTEDEARHYFRTTDNRFMVAVGNNLERHYLSRKFESLGGVNDSYVSNHARIGKYTEVHPKGVLLMADAHITNDVVIDEGVVFYLRSGVGHGTRLAPYALVSGGSIASAVQVGAYTTIGINIGVRPNIRIGSHAFIGIGSILTKDVEDYAVMFGNPAKKIRDTRADVAKFIEEHQDFSPFH